MRTSTAWTSSLLVVMMTLLAFSAGAQEIEYRYVHKVHIKHGEAWLEQSESHQSPRPFFGIYLEEDAAGVRLSDVVPGAGAEAAGLRAGDVLTAMAGEGITDAHSFRTILRQHEPGESVAVSYLRDGQPHSAIVQLGEQQRPVWQPRLERDPCKVFIGVTVSDAPAGASGVRINSIIRETPAEHAQLQTGDIILSLDDVAVSSHDELVAERNKHAPGDYFTLVLLRGEQPLQVRAQFTDCAGEQPEAVVEVVEEVVEIVEAAELPAAEPPALEMVAPPTLEIPVDRRLVVADWQVFPNPAIDRINIRFTAEALPTTIRVVDVVGKVLYQETLNGFSGTYHRELPLRDVVPGHLFLQVVQGDRVKVEKIAVVEGL